MNAMRKMIELLQKFKDAYPLPSVAISFAEDDVCDVCDVRVTWDDDTREARSGRFAARRFLHSNLNPTRVRFNSKLPTGDSFSVRLDDDTFRKEIIVKAPKCPDWAESVQNLVPLCFHSSDGALDSVRNLAAAWKQKDLQVLGLQETLNAVRKAVV